MLLQNLYEDLKIILSFEELFLWENSSSPSFFEKNFSTSINHLILLLIASAFFSLSRIFFISSTICSSFSIRLQVSILLKSSIFKISFTFKTCRLVVNISSSSSSLSEQIRLPANILSWILSPSSSSTMSAQDKVDCINSSGSSKIVSCSVLSSDKFSLQSSI